ncbi:MAG: 1-phosphofructokinase [Anaerovoracaceae bacterium]|jgi:1-phosphofructokinase
MIYTVTFNPAIDYIIHMDDFKPGATNRTTAEEYYFGGKGINVSIILGNLGIETTALGFISGFTGKALKEGLINQGVNADFIELDNGFTRINVKIKGEQETEINGQGPVIDENAIRQLFDRFDKMTPDDLLIVSGSVPKTMPSDIYEQITKKMAEKQVLTVVDATGDLLLNVLQYRPFLIKPNNDEIAEMLGKVMKTTEDIIDGAKELKNRGARNVLVSRGAKGAVLVSEDGQVLSADAIPCKAVNTVGAGDSMVAGFLAGYLKTHSYEYALKLGIAAGSATASLPGLATREAIERNLEL